MPDPVKQTAPDDLPADDQTLYLIDGSGFIYRAYFALPPLTRDDGTPVGAVLGFTNMFVKLLSDIGATHVAVAFDARRKNFRNEIYPEYKANRDAPPDDLKVQFPIIRQATDAFNIPWLETEGFEADDIIATLTERAKAKGWNVVIVSSDKDLMQLIDEPLVTMLDPMKYNEMGADAVMDKFGVGPEKVVDIQALSGDSSDNVPGVPGIGPKTGAKLLDEFGDLETLLDRAPEDVPQPKRRENLIKYADQARISKRLVTLARDMEIDVDLDDLTYHPPNPRELTEFLADQGFQSVISRLASKDDFEVIEPESPFEAEDTDYHMITTMAELNNLIDQCFAAGRIAVDTETTDLTPVAADLVGISLSYAPGKAAYIPVGHTDSDNADHTTGDLGLDDNGDGDKASVDSGDGCVDQLPMDQVIDALKPLLEDPGVIKIAHNAKYDVQILAAAGIDLAPVDDTMLMSYVLDGGKHSHGLDDLSAEFCAHEMIGYKDIVGSGKSQIGFDRVTPADALDYAAEDADITRRLHHLFRPRLTSESMASVYERIERPLIPIIAGMETQGIKVDRLILKEMSADFDQRLADLERDIHQLAGSEFNVGSPQQLGEVLFDDLGLEGGKKTKTGNWSTAADILEDQLDQLDVDSDEYRVINGVLEWRSLSKLKSTYTDALQDQINDDTGRVHTSYSMAVTATGRLSSSDPNLQNIPIRTEEGRKIRTAFVPADGHKLVSVDYSQVELRLIADIADIPAMKRAFLDGRDIHATTASEMFDVPLDEMTSDIRRKAKAINYGIIYGISAYGLARQLNIPRHEASDYIDTYFDRFPELKTYMERAKEFAREHGYVETEFGRKCYIPQIKARNYARRSYAERQAINAPIQGTAADIMKRAMIKVDDLITREMEGVKMLLQVHDELLFEIPEDMVKDVTPKIVEVMEGVYNMSVPLIADHGAGDNWDQAH